MTSSHEISGSAPDNTTAVPVSRAAGDRAVAIWLLVCCAMIFAMAVIGAITRLTESGLSIMEWAPVRGILPPMSEDEWRRVFALYREIPEYHEMNSGMTLGEFKTIFWWEYVHRLWGRLIGVVFVVPFAVFLIRGRIRRVLVPHLVAMFALGGLQGLLGWYMVASGFADRTDVSQYRLVAHLSAAVLIYGYVLWVAFGLLAPALDVSRDPLAGRLRGGVVVVLALVGLTIVSGGFVAGLNAGFTYNTFPFMDGDLIPEGYGDLRPWWLNLFENLAAVQFNHRALAIVTFAAAAGVWLWARGIGLAKRARRAVHVMLAMAVLQVGLGIATLLLVVPVWLGAAHQAGALLLLTAALWALHGIRPARSWRATP